LADQYEGEHSVHDKRVDIIEIPHFEVDLTLEKNGKIKATAILDCVALEKSVTAIPFMISKFVEVDEVTDDQGHPCFFVHEQARDKMGEPPLKQQSLVVCLPVPLPKGEKRKLMISYHSDELIKKVINRKEYNVRDTVSWYPRYGSLRRSTSKVTYRFPPGLVLVAVGKKTREWEEDGKKCSIWEQDIPVGGICFNFGDLRHKRISVEGLPPVDVYASGYKIYSWRMHNVGADVINSLNYFQKLFFPYPFPTIIATEMPRSGGQGFPGFLLLSHYSFRDDAFSGINEAFRAHEVSHQWWGHIVGWETYHDQWLSEGFAEYSGALFAQATLADKKKKLLQNIVENWKNDILNRGNLAFVRYGYPKLDRRLTMGSKSGPIWLGFRLNSSKSPLDYNILVYEKGAYVLHMLRMMMMDFKNKSDKNFFAMMKDFVKTYSWKNATTEGFRRIVEKHMLMDMKWFFDQWVYGTDIPTYKFKWHTEPGDGGKVVLVLEVKQSGVPDGFKMPVPILIDIGKDRHAVIRCIVDKSSKTFRVNLPEKPKKVEFNINGSVLCHER
jgi:aminopeptidase N